MVLERRGKLVAADEPAVTTEPFLHTIVVEDGQSDGRLSDSAGTSESKGCEMFCRRMIFLVNSSVRNKPSAAIHRVCYANVRLSPGQHPRLPMDRSA